MGWPSLLDRLPSVRGKLIENASLADITWLRVGGPAQVLFLPADAADLARFLAETPRDIDVRVLGAGSNTLVRDGGLPGVTVKLTPAFGKVEALENNRIRAGAAALDKMVAKAAAKAGIAGLEFYVGVPGAIGGALRMNAGCYGTETKDVLVEAVALDRTGRRIIAPVEELGYAYRHSDAPEDWIFIEAVFEGQADDPEAVTERMNAITERREASQPIREKTSGSTFKNPDPETSGGRSAWQLVDAAGWRGKPIGGARFSEQHCNFLINDGTATASDLETLGETVRAEVKDKFGVQLHWEVKRIGEPE
ncbi:MAG: UDP-N-acetylenolpyruvoylglucosamine reductase [Oceanicaulis sp.]|uniref:UDP-N-acetylmuramate dehydrogenase n=1 Tax=unclassified Oceanicaulis TaxID=2632123 RepID=UPI000066D6B2|nr:MULTISPECIES: UDP-N-acetylmuramate dehydrogenase [unclassified Oceanicaulis]EAP91588.1 UDP-N-acetylenolpyruvoylglucosamine reductase [Oceanicaulis sp. HTCC2633]MAB70011.1 UDP-N-acetylenolpyruvoylglucosamine reductase [Oceanicaulis sp.]MBC39761.1 UDP-N-acetylenolpyruvoylglucosamine reductase [Oceanicaulis sp.]HBU61467.1 UDP-N-acetylmuramate dehydrogenase [Oceanicaulis sp.]|tara:strand:- start:3918 stop:4841 length:924 start_codon:yes stop_codon:yes gene_type:complete